MWNDDAALGPQPEPYPGRHNSRWLQSPGTRALRAYEEHRDRLETYARGVVGALHTDSRILAWDVYNEPGGIEAPSRRAVDALCVPLLADVFAWARAENPAQPLTSGIFYMDEPQDPRIREIQFGESDIVSFHHYGHVADLEQTITALADQTGRPLLCTEYLARTEGSRFETHLPVFERHRVGAVSWGLVAGRTQTQYPWSSWSDEVPAPEPTVWFHDIFRPDGSSFDAKETDFLRATLRH